MEKSANLKALNARIYQPVEYLKTHGAARLREWNINIIHSLQGRVRYTGEGELYGREGFILNPRPVNNLVMVIFDNDPISYHVKPENLEEV